MKRQEFLSELKKELYGLPDQDIQKSLDFYAEMIDDRIEDGFLEEDAVSEIGTPQETSKQILMDIPMTRLVKQRLKPRRRINIANIVLLALGSPVWLSLLIAAVAVVFAVYVSLWSIVVSFWAIEAALIGGVLGSVVSCVVGFATSQNDFVGVAMVGATALFIGFSILFFFVCNAITKGMIWLTKNITLWIKSCFLTKECVKQ